MAINTYTGLELLHHRRLNVVLLLRLGKWFTGVPETVNMWFPCTSSVLFMLNNILEKKWAVTNWRTHIEILRNLAVKKREQQ